MEPFLRWAGGKSWLVKHLEEIIGELEINHYHEPFLGGGAIFFSTGHRLRSYLSDVNEDLIRTYIAVRDVPDEVIHFFEQFQNTEEQYYFVRAQRYNNPAQCAAQFIFLNQMSFNGIYRVNANGQYNVPYGFRVGHEYDVQRILDASAALRNTNIFVECKAAELITDGKFKKPIEALHGQMEGLRREAQSRYPKRKVKFIWATHNYIMSRADMDRFQKAIADTRDDFNPEGLQDYWLNQAKTFNDESMKYLREIETIAKERIKKELERSKGENWLITGLPKSVYSRAKKEADDQNYDIIANGSNGGQVTIWDCVTLAECQAVVVYGKNWSELFEKIFTRPLDVKLAGGKDKKTEWFSRLNTINNKLSKASYSVTTDEYTFIKEIFDWLKNI